MERPLQTGVIKKKKLTQWFSLANAGKPYILVSKSNGSVAEESVGKPNTKY